MKRKRLLLIVCFLLFVGTTAWAQQAGRPRKVPTKPAASCNARDFVAADDTGLWWGCNPLTLAWDPVTIGGTPAPANATYITQTPSSGLSAEQAMSLLLTGIVKNTTTTGVQSVIVPGTGVEAALQVNIGSAGALVLFNGAAGTPTSLVGTNITGTATGFTAGNATLAANLSGTPALPNGTSATTQSQADNSTKLATTAYADTLGATKEATANKDATGGYAGLTLFKINFKNADDTFTSFFTNSNSAARTYTFQNRDGTIADDTDLALKLNLSGGTLTGPLLFTDNTLDIGASGATRPRTGYFGTSIIAPLRTCGTGTTQTCIYKTTTGVGASGADHIFQVGNNGATEAMRILNDGKVGVGLAAPARNFVVAGGGGQATIQVVDQAQGVTASNGFQIQAFGADVNLLNYENGFVGIFTAVTERLRVSSTGTIFMYNLGTDAATTTATVCRNTSTKEITTGTGTLGICLGTSSVRFKPFLAPLNVGLAEVLKLKPVRYKLDAAHGDPNKELYGFTAEEDGKVLPALMGRDKEGRPNTFDYVGVVPALVKAVQEQNVMLDALKQRMAGQDKEIARLRGIVRRYRSKGRG